MRRPRRVLLLTLLVLGVVVIWYAWLGWQVNRDLTRSVEDVDDLRAAADAGDVAGMEAALERLQEHGSSAHRRTSGVSWSALTRVPWLGDDARGVRVVSDVVDELATNGGVPLVAASQDVSAITPREGKVSLDAVAALREPVAAAESALDDASVSLHSEDSSQFVTTLRSRYRELVTTVDDARHALSSASTALDVLPTMLGRDEPRNYLLILQNNAEIRATGGLPGSFAVVRADDGAMDLTRQGAASALSTREPLPITEPERRLYGRLLSAFAGNVNLTPDFPRVAELATARWEQAQPEEIDGVVSLDVVAVSYLLAATGPVQIGDVTLTADNAVEELLHGVYLRYEDPADQDKFFQDVARRTFDQVSAGIDDPLALLRELGRGADEGRILVHSFDESEQEHLQGTRVAGAAFGQTVTQPRIDVTLNDSTGAKMSYFLRYDVRVVPTDCTDGVQSYTGQARLESTAPADAATLPDYVTGGGFFGAPRGTQFVTVRVFTPVGGTISRLVLDGTEFEPEPVEQEGRSVDYVAVQLAPGQVSRLEWRMTSGADQPGGTDVRVTPGIAEGSSSSRVSSLCS